MAAVVPFTLSGSLSFPPDDGASNAPIAFSGAENFTQLAKGRFVMTGAGTQVVDFGTIIAPGVKAILVKVEASTTAAPVQLNINSGTDDIEVSPGGFIAYFSPVPVTGITALSIVSTTAVCVRVWLLG